MRSQEEIKKKLDCAKSNSIRRCFSAEGVCVCGISAKGIEGNGLIFSLPLPTHNFGDWFEFFVLKVLQEPLLVSIMTWQIRKSTAKKQLNDYVAPFQNEQF